MVENLDNPKNIRRSVRPENYAAPLHRFKNFRLYSTIVQSFENIFENFWIPEIRLVAGCLVLK